MCVFECVYIYIYIKFCICRTIGQVCSTVGSQSCMVVCDVSSTQRHGVLRMSGVQVQFLSLSEDKVLKLFFIRRILQSLWQKLFWGEVFSDCASTEPVWVAMSCWGRPEPSSFHVSGGCPGCLAKKQLRLSCFLSLTMCATPSWGSASQRGRRMDLIHAERHARSAFKTEDVYVLRCSQIYDWALNQDLSHLRACVSIVLVLFQR